MTAPAPEPIPPDVNVTHVPREPVTDPTLGIEVPTPAGDIPTHRLVSIGDSLTHGFQSLAIHLTDLSYPALIARVLGWYDHFRHPRYDPFGGLPLNLEYLIRQVDQRFHGEPNWWQLPEALLSVRSLVDQIERYWSAGAGLDVPHQDGINHDLGVYGWDLRDVLSRSADTERAGVNQILGQGAGGGLPPNPLGLGANLQGYMKLCGHLAGLRVLESARDGQGKGRTPLEAAKALGQDGGIETLTVFIGANNCLGSVLRLEVHWSGDGYDELVQKEQYNVWRPIHFAAELALIVEQLRAIQARHVIVCTVPHVTIAPVARGVGGKSGPGSRYFRYYTRPWIDEAHFRAEQDPHLTADDARAVDSAIDQYNYAITDAVRAAREDMLDWRLLDTAGLLDRLAERRYAQDPAARPSWWTPFPMPPEVAALKPKLDSRFYSSGPEHHFLGFHWGRVVRKQGGLFALEGVHPTTVAYGLLAQEFIKVMAGAGVAFPQPDPRVDFPWLIHRDTLISNPPASVGGDLSLLAAINETVDIVNRLIWH